MRMERSVIKMVCKFALPDLGDVSACSSEGAWGIMVISGVFGMAGAMVATGGGFGVGAGVGLGGMITVFGGTTET